MFPSTAIAIFKTPDVRPVIQAYEGKNIPIEFAKKETEMKQRHIEEFEHSRKGLSRGGLTLSGLFGGSEKVRRRFFVSSPSPSPSPAISLQLCARDERLMRIASCPSRRPPPRRH